MVFVDMFVHEVLLAEGLVAVLAVVGEQVGEVQVLYMLPYCRENTYIS